MISPLRSPVEAVQAITEPNRVFSRREVLDGDVVPRTGGVYGWYFADVPVGVPTEGCATHHRLTLLYAGIAPKAPPQNGGRASAQSLRTRVRYHMRGNAEGSTLRLTLGCLLREQLGTILRRVGSGKRHTFHTAEAQLSQWMEQNAFVCWIAAPDPWSIESALIASVNLPLNLEQNRSHGFHGTLSGIRRAARQAADRLPIL